MNKKEQLAGLKEILDNAIRGLYKSEIEFRVLDQTVMVGNINGGKGIYEGLLGQHTEAKKKLDLFQKHILVIRELMKEVENEKYVP